MKDRALDILLMIFFGTGGIIILVITWSQPMVLAERILSTSIGMIGVVWVAARVMFLRPAPAEVAVKRAHIKDTIEEG